jgi:predicted PurR-regulated permease PerM
MNKSNLNFPLYAKTTFALLTLVLIFVVIYFGQHILIPIFLSLLFAILLSPIVKFFNTHLKTPNAVSSIISIVLLTVIVTTIIIVVSSQIIDFYGEINSIKINISRHAHTIQLWIKNTLNISYLQQELYVNDVKSNSLTIENLLSKSMLNSVTDFLLNFFLVPFYLFLFLFYKKLFLQFLKELVSSKNHSILEDILVHIKSSVQRYLVGLIIEMIIVSTLTSIGFMIIGIQYAVLLGIITGILNLIPYVGILSAGLLSVFATLGGESNLNIVFGVIIVNVIVQIIDNNLVVPLIVSSNVKINAVASIIGIIIGGSLLGIAGMFLAIPLIAILKVIFDRVDFFKPFGLLLGDALPKV